MSAGETVQESTFGPWQVVQLKTRLRNESQLLPKLSSWIAFSLNMKERADASPGKQLTVMLAPEEFALNTARLAGSWALSLSNAVNLPGPEWPNDGSTRPEDVSAWLEEMEGAIEFRKATETADA